MSEETRLILEKLDNMQEDIREMKQDIKELKEDVVVLKEDVAVLKEDVAVLKEDVTVLKEDVRILKKEVKVLRKEVDVLKEQVTQLNSRMEDVEGAVVRLDTTIENKIWKAIKVTGEGHDFLKMGVEEARSMQVKNEWMEIHILKLESDMLRVKEVVGIV